MNATRTGGEGGKRYESVTRTILEAVADREGTLPVDLDPPLHDVVDPDALNAIFASTADGQSRSGGRVEFCYCGYEVTVFSDGNVRVRDPTGSASLGTPAATAADSERDGGSPARPRGPNEGNE